MLARTKLLSAASALAMAMAVGAAYADELTADQLDTITAGAAAAAASSSGNTAAAVASSGTTGTSTATVIGGVVLGVPIPVTVVSVANPGAGAIAF